MLETVLYIASIPLGAFLIVAVCAVIAVYIARVWQRWEDRNSPR